eukprot:6177897-Pleurochrysis_carterae.AAC.2
MPSLVYATTFRPTRHCQLNKLGREMAKAILDANIPAASARITISSARRLKAFRTLHDAQEC